MATTRCDLLIGKDHRQRVPMIEKHLGASGLDLVLELENRSILLTQTAKHNVTCRGRRPRSIVSKVERFV